jgi:hypothetical protein
MQGTSEETLFCTCVVVMVMQVSVCTDPSRLLATYDPLSPLNVKHLPIELLEYLLSILPASAVQTTNESQSPPLHWAILNSHLNCVKILVEWPEEKGGGMPLLNVSEGYLDSVFEANFH